MGNRNSVAKGFDTGVLFCSWERLKPGCEGDIKEIEAEVEYKLDKVDWLPSCYSLSPHVQIANSKAYQQGKVVVEFSVHDWLWFVVLVQLILCSGIQIKMMEVWIKIVDVRPFLVYVDGNA